jgi:hypothetical protein
MRFRPTAAHPIYLLPFGPSFHNEIHSMDLLSLSLSLSLSLPLWKVSRERVGVLDLSYLRSY